jgi:hypothetical protein
MEQAHANVLAPDVKFSKNVVLLLLNWLTHPHDDVGCTYIPITSPIVSQKEFSLKSGECKVLQGRI